VAKHQYYKLIPLGFVLGLVVQAGSSLLPTPKSMPMDQFFRTQTDVWIATAFGTLLAPVFEEIAFRGFLLPAFAIAYDWLSLKRTPEVRRLWQTTTNLSRMAYVFATVLTSLVFALLHAAQLGDAWSAVAVLFLVSVILCIVRLRTGSVAASAMVHACYNFAVFVMIFIGTGGYRHLDRLSH
jgi:membrane protease YdiL (CAAX protease family)